MTGKFLEVPLMYSKVNINQGIYFYSRGFRLNNFSLLTALSQSFNNSFWLICAHSITKPSARPGKCPSNIERVFIFISAR